MTFVEKLNLLADWYDVQYPEGSTEVQDDLRRMAAMLMDFYHDLMKIDSEGTLPDGDSVNTPTRIWAEDWVRRLKGE